MEECSSTVFGSFGVLEHVLSYASPKGLVQATEVNQRWKEAGRSDVLWKTACVSLWKDRKGMRGISGEGEIPLFWRSSLSDEVIELLAVRQIRALFDNFLLHEQKQGITNCLEKSEMRRLVRNYTGELQLSDERVRYSDLWFGSYASSVLDAQRQQITKEELCNPHGFDTYFKVLEEEVWDSSDLEQLIPYEGRPGIMLYQHSVCYFDPNNEFVMEVKQGDAHYPVHLQWLWNGSLVQVGPYPHLVITRLPNWGWKLENVHVVMLFRDSRADTSSRR